MPADRYRAPLDRDTSVPAGAMIALEQLNALPAAAFITALDGIFEHSPWVAQRTAPRRPFDSCLSLLEALRASMLDAPAEDQVALILAHPRLGARGRAREQLTRASNGEQRGAGLDACSPEEFSQLDALNTQYESKFRFPFILAIKGHDPTSIIANCRQRLSHTAAAEQHTALTQIGLIAGYRLSDAVSSEPGGELLAMLERMQAGALDSRLREWMLAAGLDSQSGPAAMAGVLKGSAPAPERKMLRLELYPGFLGTALGIALARQLRQQQVSLAFDLYLFARSDDPTRAKLAAAAPALRVSAVDALGAPAAVIDRRWANDAVLRLQDLITMQAIV